MSESEFGEPDTDFSDADTPGSIEETDDDPNTGTEDEEAEQDDNILEKERNQGDPFDDEQGLATIGTDWEAVYNSYANASNRNKRRDARASAIDILEAQYEWMSVKEWGDVRTPDLHVWDAEEERWREDGFEFLQTLLDSRIGTYAEHSECNHIRRTLAARNRVEEDELNSIDEVDLNDGEKELLDDVEGGLSPVPFRNGVLILNSIELDGQGRMVPGSWELIENRPEFRFTYQLPVKWDPTDADYDTIDWFVRDVTSDRGRTSQETDIRTLWEFGGHSFFREYSPSGFLMAIGEGSDGKTMFFDVIQAVLGTENTSGATLEKIVNGQFSAAEVVDRLANIAADIEGTVVNEIADLKWMTGGDRSEVRAIYDGPEYATNSATMLFGANEPPAITEKKFSLKRRLYPVEFPYRFKSDPDPDAEFEKQKRPRRELKRELTQPEVLRAAAVRMAEGAARLLENDEWTLGMEMEPDERMEMYEQSADPIADFGKTCLRYARDGPGIEIGDLKATYDRFSLEEDHPEKTENVLIRELNRLNSVDMSKSRPRSWSSGDDRDTVYTNIAFTEEAKKKYVPESAHWDKYGGKPERIDDGSDVDRMAEVSPGDEGIVLEGTVIHSVPDYAVCTLEDDSERPLQVSETCGAYDREEYEWRLDSVLEGDEIRIEGDVGRDGRGLPKVWVRPHHDVEVIEKTDDVDYEDENEDELAQQRGVAATLNTISELADPSGEGAPVGEVIADVSEQENCREERVEHWLEKLVMRGDVYDVSDGHYRCSSDVV